MLRQPKAIPHGFDLRYPSPAQLPPHVHPLQNGDPGRIGDYTLIGRLGSGGMGTVYAGVSAELGRVAVKVAHPAPGDQSQSAGSGGSESRANTRFKREIELMRRVQGVAADLSAIPEEIRGLVRRSLATRAADRPEAVSAYEDCVRALGEEPGEPGRQRELRELLGERWPSIDIGWDRPSRWLGAAAAVAASGSAPVHDPGGSGADLGGTGAARVAEGLAGSGAGGSGTGAVAGSGAGTGGTGGASMATGGTGAVGAAGAGAKMTSMIVGGCLGVAVVAGGGYLALDRLGGDEEEVQVAAEPEEEPEEPDPLTAPELLEAAQESVMEADDYELLMYSFGTESPEPRQEAPADPDAPYTFDYAHVLAGPGEPAYRASHMNWLGGSTVTMSVDGELVYETPDGGWVGAAPGDRTNPDAHATEHIFEVFFGILDAGQNTDEDESDFVPIPAPEAEFEHPEADPVDTAVRIDGEITHEGLEGEVTTAYTLVTTPEGVPLSFSWALSQTNYDEWQRPWPMGNPTTAMWGDFHRDQPYTYTEYTFVSVDEGVELEVPEPDEIAAWDD
ncbi:hypothetical protein [Nocardiopsis nanhaiensis]